MTWVTWYNLTGATLDRNYSIHGYRSYRVEDVPLKFNTSESFHRFLPESSLCLSNGKAHFMVFEQQLLAFKLYLLFANRFGEKPNLCPGDVYPGLGEYEAVFYASKVKERYTPDYYRSDHSISFRTFSEDLSVPFNLVPSGVYFTNRNAATIRFFLDYLSAAGSKIVITHFIQGGLKAYWNLKEVRHRVSHDDLPKFLRTKSSCS